MISVAAASAETEIIAVALTPPTGITRDRFNEMAATVAARFEGGARMTLMLDGQAGSEEAMAAALRRGRVHFSQLTIPGIASAVPELSILMAPYLFDSFEEEDFVLDNFIFPVAHRLFADRGLELFGFSDSGWFIAFSREPMPNPDAARNQRLRAAGGDASRLFLSAIGADVVEMAFAEVIPALQTGLVKGGVTNVMMYESASLWREAPHLIMTRHALNPGANSANKAWFDKLTPGNQKLIREGLGSMHQMRAGTRREMEQGLANLRAAGAKIYEPTPAELEQWRSMGIATHNELVRRIGGKSQELYDAAMAGKRAYAAR
ncbi:MAG: TRAP transporter substrate-binding protein [Alphaproteobacteria bacterium]|nr:TRAP transporter substrate-binding protein [Alphaproteobacteria bacterium]